VRHHCAAKGNRPGGASHFSAYCDLALRRQNLSRLGGGAHLLPTLALTVAKGFFPISIKSGL